MEKIVAYYRISKEPKKKEGRYLGIEAQQAIVEHYYPELERTFTEVKSGKNINEREQLQQAVDYCKKHKAILVVAKLDRLSRSVEDCLFIWKELKGNVRFCDIPGTPDKFTITMYAAFAERERELISLRTSQALQSKIKNEGNWNRNHTVAFLSGEVAKKAVEAHKEKAKNNPNNKIAANIICTVLKGGSTLKEVADKLNALGCKTSTGKEFNPIQVSRIRDRYCS
jgi:DNA invertase Pin-like site-specific DNA recombinase